MFTALPTPIHTDALLSASVCLSHIFPLLRHRSSDRRIDTINLMRISRVYPALVKWLAGNMRPLLTREKAIGRRNKWWALGRVDKIKYNGPIQC